MEVEGSEEVDDDPGRRRPPLAQEGGDARRLVGPPLGAVERAEPRVAQLVVGGDRRGLDADQREHQHRRLPGAVTAAVAVEDDAAGTGAGDRANHRGAAIGKAFEVRPVVERRRELRAVFPEVPELAVLDHVERDVHGLDRGRARSEVGADLRLVAKIDDGADPERLDFLPAPRLEPLQGVGADDRAAPGDAAVAGRQPAEVARVEGALPAEMPVRHRRTR